MSLLHVWRIQATISHSTCQVNGGWELIAIRYQSVYLVQDSISKYYIRLIKNCMQTTHIFQTLISLYTRCDSNARPSA